MAKSTLTNPLANYRTYSYHHFFVICKDSATANQLAESTGVDMYQRPTSNRTLQNGSYVTVIDSRRDADFLIQELTIKNILVPPANCCSTAGSRLFGLEGEVKIFEPRGVSFLNLLVGATTAMNISPAESSFVIKTIFIGHKEDGAQEVVGNVRPFVCTATDIMATVTEEGTTYTFKTMGNMDGRALQPEFNTVSEQTGIVVKKGEKLPEVLKKLTDAYNEKYGADAKAVGELIKDKGVDMNKITKVKYEVKLSPEKSTVLSQLDDFGTLIPETLKLGGQNGEAIIRGGPAGVHDHIHKIMTSSKKLNELVKGNIKGEQEAPQQASKATPSAPESDAATDQGTPPKEFITYKIRTLWENTAPGGGAGTPAPGGITSGAEGGETAGEIKITYIIEEYKILQNSYKDQAGQTKTSTTLPEDASVIEFDYIFTGKNTDVLDLDINMKYAFANWLNGGSRPQGGAQTQEMDVKGTSAGVQGASAYSAHPLALSTPTGQPMPPAPFVGRKQSTSPQINQHAGEIITPLSTEAMWRWHSAMEQLHTKMTIHGNPILLEQMSMPGGGSSEGWSFRWTNVPAYAKVNIKFPKYKYDVWETGPQYPADFFEDFWYQDYYQILYVTNIFSGGVFTQELEMMSMIQTSESSTDRKQPTGAVGASGTPASRGATPKNLGDSKNAEKAMKYLQSKGYTPAQAAGIVGNLQAESGQKLNTGAVGDGGKALGIAQWHPDRQKGLMNYASQTGKDPYALETQLDWVDIEIKGQDAKYNGGFKNGGKNTYSALMNATTPDQAAYAIQKYYERCKVCGDGYLLNDRKAYTNNVYNRYGNPESTASTTAQTQQPVQATQQTVADATVAHKTSS